MGNFNMKAQQNLFRDARDCQVEKAVLLIQNLLVAPLMRDTLF